MTIMLRSLLTTLPRFSYRLGNEIELHQGIAQVLDNANFEYQREFIASPTDRYDFLISGGIVIEAKIKGSFSKALEQVKRYAKSDGVTAVILVTTKLWGTTPAAESLSFHGKPIHVIKLRRSAF